MGYGLGDARLAMSRNKNADKREKSMAEFIVVVIILSVLMKIFINYFSKQEQQITTTGFTAIAQNFNSSIAVVHAQWFMDKQPSIVLLATQGKKEKVAITVNKHGWIDISEKVTGLTNINPCESIWQLAMSIPMQLMKFSIAAIELRDNGLGDFHHCRYLLPTGQYFEYYSETGKVTKVSQVHLN